MKVPLLNFKGGPGTPLLNFGGGPGVPLLNFEGGPGLRVPGSRGPGVLVPLLHHAVLSSSKSRLCVSCHRNVIEMLMISVIKLTVHCINNLKYIHLFQPTISVI